MLKKVRESEFNPHVLAILSGSTLAQLIPLIVNQQKKFFALSLSINILIVLAFIMGYYINGDIETAFILISAFQIIFHLYLGYWFYRISKKGLL